MLGILFGPPVFDAHSYAQGLLQFGSSKSLTVGSTVTGHLRLPDGKKTPIQLQVVQKERSCYAGRVLGPETGVDLLNQYFLPGANRQIHDMHYKVDIEDGTHHMRTYAIRSPRFPNFKAVTVDISAHSAIVMLDGSIPIEVEFPVELDLDDTDLESMKFSAKAEWCRQRDDKVWVAQLEFCGIGDQQRSQLKGFLEQLKHRAPGNRVSK